MSKTSKRAISILVIAILALSFVLPLVGVSALLGTPTNAPAFGQYGDVITVTGNVGDAVGGATMEIYWDTVIGADAHLLNSTTAESDGNWEVNFDVPEATTGDHFVWVKDTTGPFYESSAFFTVNPLVELDPSSGLKTDDVDVMGYGFGEEVVIGIIIDPWTIAPAEAVGDYVGGLAFSGALDYYPVVAASTTVTETISGETFAFSGPPVAGVEPLIGSLLGTGSLNLNTGALTLDFSTSTTAPLVGDPITAVYDRDAVTIEASTSFETDELGSFTKAFDIPNFPYGTYVVRVAEVLGPVITADLTIGASITVTPDEGPTGTVVTVEGRGWTSGETITFREETSFDAIEVVDRDVITVGGGGTFSADVVIPVLGSEDKYYIEAQGTVTPDDSSDGFELNGLPEVEVSPVYGTPGASITVSGSNFTQISGVEVTVTINTLPTTMELVIAETNSDGTFEDTFMSPWVKHKVT